MSENNSEIIIYQTDDGKIKIDVQIEDETVWLTQSKIAELFVVDRSVVTKHLQNIFREGELDKKSTSAKFAQVRNEGQRQITRDMELYNLDAIISVGYRVNSAQATQFRIWATQRLREYIIKGFTMNDDLLRKAGGGKYFDELIKRIRDIRSSEKVFYRKILDIYATSIDYNPDVETSKKFFQIIQNKMHWAAHQHTAAELIILRANSKKPFMGLTSFTGRKPQKDDILIAKNYLSSDELDTLNLIVSAYLDFAELQAKKHKPMKMKDWIIKLDNFLQLSEHEILKDAGKISNKIASEKALKEYKKYKKKTNEELSEVEKHFFAEIEKTNKLLKNKIERSKQKEH